MNAPDTLVGEQWRDGKPVAFADLPSVQQEWLETNSVRAGKELVWNAKSFALTRDGQATDVIPAAPTLGSGKPGPE